MDDRWFRLRDHGRYVAWEAPLSTHQNSDMRTPTPRMHFVASGFGLVILAALLAPGDGGTLLNHWLVVIVLSHVTFYLLHFSRNSLKTRALLTRLTVPTNCFLFSIACVILMTVALTTGIIPEYLGLAG